MADSDTVLMTVAIPGEKPGIVQAAKALGVGSKALDKGFGVILVDPDRHLYAVQVRASAVPGMAADGTVQGPCSNPKISPYGPPRR